MVLKRKNAYKYIQRGKGSFVVQSMKEGEEEKKCQSGGFIDHFLWDQS